MHKKILTLLILCLMLPAGAQSFEEKYCAQKPYPVGGIVASGISNATGVNFTFTKLAELAIREAKWVGFPVEALKQLNFILSDDCLCCDMWDLVNAIIGIENRKKTEN